MTVQRHGQIVRVRPDKRDEYLELHTAVWPEVEAIISACNIHNYSIFAIDDVLIAYFEYTGSDFEADMARMADDPITREWWSHTDPCQERWTGATTGPMWADATEVWHLE